ncbi:hypothetical protein [Petrimonas sp.]|uniref:hypothetical protein n=1 Tax=Petrimonas sp. TaxID=2023866 RepID=UPI002FCB8342
MNKSGSASDPLFRVNAPSTGVLVGELIVLPASGKGVIADSAIIAPPPVNTDATNISRFNKNLKFFILN